MLQWSQLDSLLLSSQQPSLQLVAHLEKLGTDGWRSECGIPTDFTCDRAIFSRNKKKNSTELKTLMEVSPVFKSL